MAENGFEDVTTQFRKYCSELKVGEMIMHHSLNLHDAMQAVELMDPRMDAGMECNTNMIENFQDAVRLGLKLESFSIEETVGIMDQVFTLLGLWFHGNNLGQTVFTCMYTHKPQQINDNVIRVFMEGILHLVQMIQSLCLQVCCFEEEDFVCSLYGFDMCSWKRSSSVLDELKEYSEKESTNIATRLRLLHNLLSATSNLLELQPLPTILRTITQAQTQLNNCLESLGCGITFPQSGQISPFQPHINSHLLGSMPLREIESISTEEAFKYILHETACIKIGMHIFSCKTLEDITAFYSTFGREGGGAVSRSIVYRCLCQDPKQWLNKHDPQQLVKIVNTL